MAEAAHIPQLHHRGYTPRIRAERLIAVARVGFAALSLLAIWLDPTEPAKHAGATYLSLELYVFYAAVLAGWVWLSRRPPAVLGPVSHGLDLLV